MQAIRKTLAAPHRTLGHRHARLLKAIADSLCLRDYAGYPTTLVKVRAHTGIAGNEEADKLAKAATKDYSASPFATATPDESVSAFGWSTCDTGDDLVDAAAVAAAALSARVATIIRTKPTSTAARWAAGTSDLLASESNAFRSSRLVPFHHKRLLIQLRCQRWLTNAQLCVMHIAPSPRCPHCNHSYDDSLHTLSACTHPVLNGLITYRHDHATHIIADAIRKSHFERPFHLFVSAGRRYAEHATATPFAHTTQSIPDWALPGNAEKPDLVLILGWSADMPPPPAPTQDIEFVIADVSFNRGYCSQQRITDKQAKYSPLAQSLRARGWAVRCVAAETCAFPHPSPNDEPPPPPPLHLTDIAVISLGTTGELYTSTLNSLKALNIDKARLAPLLSSLHLLSIKHAASITRVRRKLDSLLRPGAPAGIG